MKGGMAKKKDLSIHQIRNLNLEEVDLDNEYQILDVVQECTDGHFGRIHIARHKATDIKVALKVVPRDNTKLADFLREFHYSYWLSPHNNIVNTYDVAFASPAWYVFAQEPSPCGDLASAVTAAGRTGLPELAVREFAKQISSALEFVHSQQLVHRDVVPQNILFFSSDYSRAKLTGFRNTRREGSRVRRKAGQCDTTWLPPEICEAVRNEDYDVKPASDVWQASLLILYALTGGDLPWSRADITDPAYNDFVQWQKRKTTRIPAAFRKYTPRLMRLLRRVMDSKPEKRSEVTEFSKYVDNKWLVSSRSVSRVSDGSGTGTQLEKARGKGTTTTSTVGQNLTVGQGLLDVLTVCGIDTTVDRHIKNKRVEQWLMTAAPTST